MRLVILLPIVSVIGLVATNVSAQEAAPQPTGLIVGRVVDGATGQPVPSATVRILAPGSGRAAPTRATDALSGPSGGFFFSRLPAGSYFIYADKAGYLQSVWGQRRPGGGAAQLPLGDAERIAGLTLTLWPWASIAGIVVDDLGRPLPNAVVFAKRQLPQGSREDPVERSAHTDGAGRYEVQGLMPGTYVVGVRTLTMNVMLPADADPVAAGAVVADPSSMTIAVDPSGRDATMIVGPARDVVNPAAAPTAYVSTYYGGATTPASSARVTIAPGEERAGIDITMAARSTSRVSGVVLGPDGPAAFAVIHLLPADFQANTSSDIEDAIAIAVAGPTGVFTFRSAPAGTYLLDAYQPDQRGRQVRISPVGLPQITVPSSSAGRRAHWARMPITIGEADIDDLTLVLRRSAVVLGSIRVDGQAATDATRRPLRLSLSREATGTRQPSSEPIALGADPSTPFAIANVEPGWYVVTAGTLPEGLEIGAVTLAGRDVTGMPIEVGTRDLENVEITLTDQPATISGRVLDAAGGPARDATVVLFPTDRTRWSKLVPAAKHVQSVRASGGMYELRGFGAGEYYVAAVDDAVMGEFPDVTLLSRLVAGAERVRIETGQRVVRDLRDGTWPGRVSPARGSPDLKVRPTPSRAGVGRTFRSGRSDHDLPLAEGPIDDVVQAPARGRLIAIVTDDTGAAIPGARVMLTSETVRFAKTLVADAAGEARFDDLLSGRYHISASAPGHVTRGFLQLRGVASGVAIELPSGLAYRAALTLPRTGSISGVIRDEHGFPVSTTVRLQTLGTSDGRTVLRTTGSTKSNRRGEYRFVDLTPDDYLVSIGGEDGAVRRMTPELIRLADAAAAGGSSAALDELDEAARYSYLTIFHPNALTHLAAAPIAVEPARHVSGIDLQMQLSPVTVVEGRLFTPAAGDVAYGNLRLRGTGSLVGLSLTGQATAAGTFRFPSVVPGQYTLIASGRDRTRVQAGSGMRPGSTYWATADVIASAGQVTSLDVTLRPGQPITGRVVFEGTSTPRWEGRRPTLSLVARDDGFSSSPSAASNVAGAIETDGMFRIDSVPPGTYTFSDSRRAFEGWMLESVTAGGRDLVDVPFTITTNTGLTDVVATFVERLASVSGVILNREGRPAPQYRILIYPADPALREPWSRRIRIGVPDSTGRFTIEDLPAGDYLIAAGATLEDDGSLGSADLEAFVPSSVPVSLSRGEAKTQNFQIAGGG